MGNPLDIVSDWFGTVKRAVGAPLATSFLSISNDPTGNRAWPKGYDEVKSRTIAPKVKDFDPKLRITGIPGFNLFGSPRSSERLFFVQHRQQQRKQIAGQLSLWRPLTPDRAGILQAFHGLVRGGVSVCTLLC